MLACFCKKVFRSPPFIQRETRPVERYIPKSETVPISGTTFLCLSILQIRISRRSLCSINFSVWLYIELFDSIPYSTSVFRPCRCVAAKLSQRPKTDLVWPVTFLKSISNVTNCVSFSTPLPSSLVNIAKCSKGRGVIVPKHDLTCQVEVGGYCPVREDYCTEEFEN